MDTKGLIQILAKDSRTVKSFKSIRIQVILLFLCIIFCIAFFSSYFGLRDDLNTLIRDYYFSSSLIFLLIALLLSLVGVVKSTIPGEKFYSIVLSAGVLFFMSILHVLPQKNISFLSDEPDHYCAYFILIVSSILTLFLLFQSKRNYILDLKTTCITCSGASALSGFTAITLICPNPDTSHILLWHYIPVLLFSFCISNIIFLVVTFCFRKRDHSF